MSRSALAQPVEEREPPPPPGVDVRDVAAAYRAARFEDCVLLAKRLLDSNSPDQLTEPNEVDAATTYLGTCLVRTGHTTEAEKLFEQWIYDGAKRNAVPSKPNVAVYGSGAAEAYEVAYGRVSARLEAERKAALAVRDKAKDDAEQLRQQEAGRQQALLELARSETVVTENRRWLACVPFGVGQFQNDKPGLGWLFLTTETAAFGVMLGGMAAEIELGTHGGGQTDQSREASDLPSLSTKSDRARATWVIGMYTFAALGAGGILEANLNFVPRFERQRKRPIPKEFREPTVPKKQVRVGPFGVPGGVGLGVAASF